MLLMLPVDGTKYQHTHASLPTGLVSHLINIFSSSFSFLTDLREVLRFWCCLCVKLRHWDTPGCNLGAKHGCWVND